MTAICKKAGLFLAAVLLFGGCGRTGDFEGADGTSEDGLQTQPEDDTGVSGSTSVADSAALPARLIQPENLRYQGAFRLPEGSGGSNWEYSDYAMTYCPEGDLDGPDDGYPGSIFALGHDHQQMASEIGIPVPLISAKKNPDDLNSFLVAYSITFEFPWLARSH